MRTREETPTEERRARDGDRTVERRHFTPGPGLFLGLLGGAGVVISIFLSWSDPTGKPKQTPFAFLFDHTPSSHNPSLLIALIPIAVVLAVGALLPGGAPARLLAGLAMVAVAVLFGYQLHEVLRDQGGSLGNALNTGFYFAAIGGVVGLISGLMPTYLAGRRTVDRRYGRDERYDSDRNDAEDRAVNDVRGDREYASGRSRRHFWNR